MSVVRIIYPIKYYEASIEEGTVFQAEVDGIKVSLRTVIIEQPGAMDLYDYQVISKVFQLGGYIKGYQEFKNYEITNIIKPTLFFVVDLDFHFHEFNFRTEKFNEVFRVQQAIQDMFYFEFRDFHIDYSIAINSLGLKREIRGSVNQNNMMSGIRKNPCKVICFESLSDKFIQKYERIKYLESANEHEYSNRVSMSFDLYSKSLYEHNIRNKFLLAMIAVEALFKKDHTEKQNACKQRITSYLEGLGFGEQELLNRKFYNTNESELGFFQFRNFVAHGDVNIKLEKLQIAYNELLPMLEDSLIDLRSKEVEFLTEQSMDYFSFIESIS